MTQPLPLLVINDPHSMRINAALAAEIGLNESIVFLQLEFLIRIAHHERDGKLWTYQSLRCLHTNYFPWWGLATIQRTIEHLLERELIHVGNYNEKEWDETRWFALNATGIQRLRSVQLANAPHAQQTTTDPIQNGSGVIQNGSGVIEDGSGVIQNGSTLPETPPETSPETPAENPPLPPHGEENRRDEGRRFSSPPPNPPPLHQTNGRRAPTNGHGPPAASNGHHATEPVFSSVPSNTNTPELDAMSDDYKLEVVREQLLERVTPAERKRMDDIGLTLTEDVLIVSYSLAANRETAESLAPRIGAIFERMGWHDHPRVMVLVRHQDRRRAA